MHETVPSLAAWEAFYVIVGTSAAALTGLQFVVMTLIADSSVRRSTSTVAAYGSPTVVHFSIVVLIAAIISAPWTGLVGVRVAIGATGVGGLVYGSMVTRRAIRQRDYTPVLEDWLWHVVLPLVAYAALGAAALVMRPDPVFALFTIGGAALLLLFIGIHNAWDTVTYITVAQFEQGRATEPTIAPAPGNGEGGQGKGLTTTAGTEKANGGGD